MKIVSTAKLLSALAAAMTLAMTLAVATAPAHAGILIYNISQNGGLAGFNAAAGNPPISIDFDGIAPGTNINGATIGGVLFQPSASGAPLIVVRGSDTLTPAVGFNGVIDPSTNKLFPTSGANVLSPGGVILGPGPNDPIENDDLVLTFQAPVTAFGFDHLSQSADGFSFTGIAVFNQSNVLLFSGTIPISNIGGLGGGAPGGADFWGAVATGADQIASIVVNEADGDNNFPDCNIGFDSFRFGPTVPEPATFALLLVGLPLCGFFRRRAKRLR